MTTPEHIGSETLKAAIDLAADVRWIELAQGSPFTIIDRQMLGEMYHRARLASEVAAWNCRLSPEPAVGVEREAIARIIDPEAWDVDGMGAWKYPSRWNDADDKADAILAALSSGVGGDLASCTDSGGSPPAAAKSDSPCKSEKGATRCAKPGCGALRLAGKPCHDGDCPQQWLHWSEIKDACDLADAWSAKETARLSAGSASATLPPCDLDGLVERLGRAGRLEADTGLSFDVADEDGTVVLTANDMCQAAALLTSQGETIRGLEKRNVEVSVLAHGWMVAYDMRRAGKAYTLPSRADVPNLTARAETAEAALAGVREALRGFAIYEVEEDDDHLYVSAGGVSATLGKITSLAGVIRQIDAIQRAALSGSASE